MNKFSKFTINSQKTIRDAFKKQDSNNEQFVVIIDDVDDVIGVVTDGDFRRAIWSSISLEDPISTIANKAFAFLPIRYGVNQVKEIFSTTNVRHIPVLKKRKLVDIVFKRNIKGADASMSKPELSVPIVIMAGGIGSRLDPFTRILPKPLIPIGEKPVIEIIMEKFAEYNAKQFYISLHYKAKMIKAFFEDVTAKYNISFIEERKPLGTIGSLKFLERKIKTPFFVSNCDVIIETDYTKILDFHNEGHYALTIVGSMQHYVIPYGVCNINDGGKLDTLKEKPAYDFLVNTGMYIIEPDTLRHIPSARRFDVTEFIDKLKENNEKIGVYPISEKSWVDIGQWEEYKKTVEKLKLFK